MFLSKEDPLAVYAQIGDIYPFQVDIYLWHQELYIYNKLWALSVKLNMEKIWNRYGVYYLLFIYIKIIYLS